VDHFIILLFFQDGDPHPVGANGAANSVGVQTPDPEDGPPILGVQNDNQLQLLQQQQQIQHQQLQPNQQVRLRQQVHQFADLKPV
jgi:hypothetical protein